jgi:hypothetical protein
MAHFKILMDPRHHVACVFGVLFFHVSLQVVPETLLVKLFHRHRGGIFDLHVDEVQELQGQPFYSKRKDTDILKGTVAPD